jgi:hypothetical protein
LAYFGNQLSQKAGKDRSFPQKAMRRLLFFLAIVWFSGRNSFARPSKNTSHYP